MTTSHLFVTLSFWLGNFYFRFSIKKKTYA